MKNILILLFLLPCFLYAQDGTIDLGFNNPVHLNNPLYNGFSSSNSSDGATVITTKILSNGKIAVYGDFDLYQGITTNKLAILNPDGSLDTSFNVGLGPNYVDQYLGSSSMISEQSDGKLIVVGSFTTFNGTSKKDIVRLNLDGTIDTSFNVGSSSNGYITCVKIQDDGKILCGGNFSQFNGQAYSSMVRLNTDGTIDNSFNIGLGFKNIINSFTEDGTIKTIDVQNDNKIIVGGNFLKFNNVVKINLVRLNSNGTIDNSFNIGIGAGNNTTDGSNNGQINKIIYDNSSDKIYVTGAINHFNGNPSFNLLRLDNDGTIDTTFNFTSIIGSSGVNYNGYIYDMNLQSNGKILLGGENINLNDCTGFYCSSIVQINQDGTIDDTFDCKLVGAYTTVYSIDSLNDSIFISGQFTSVNFTPIYKGSIAKISQNGLTDLSFNPNLGTDPYTPAFASSISLNDGNIIANPAKNLNGYTNGIYNERITAGLVKITSDGSINQNDYENFLTSNLSGSCLTKDNASSLICSSGYTQKIGENGIIDDSFTSSYSIIAPNNVNISVYDHAVQNDGKIIIGGNFRYTYEGNSSYRQRLMRVNTDGTLDTSFNVGKGINGISVTGTEGYFINTIALVPNDKIILGGVFTNYNDNTVSNIVRLNSDGDFDPTFISGTGFNNNVYKIIYQQNIDKLIVAGRFTSYNSFNSNYIIRLNSDGTIDSTFTSPFAIGSTTSHIINMVIQPDNKYIISGMIDGIEFLKRLNSDGTIDDTFADNTFTASQITYWNNPVENDLIRNISLLSDNKILISGKFDHINSIRRNGIAVLNNSSSLLSTDEFDKDSLNSIYIYPNPVIDEFELNSLNEEVSIYSLEGRFIKKFNHYETKFNISDLKKGVYILKIKNQKSFTYKKLIKK